jgi:hypothetical protein
VTLNRLPGTAQSVVFQLVIAGYHPNFSFVFYPYLRAANNVASRVQGHFDTIHENGLVPAYAFNVNGGTQSQL